MVFLQKGCVSKTKTYSKNKIKQKILSWIIKILRDQFVYLIKEFCLASVC